MHSPHAVASTAIDIIGELYQRATKEPQAAAACFDDQTISYGELRARSLRVAAALSDQGVGPDVIVGLCAHRSIEYIVGLVGILASGGACMPFDPSYPARRLNYMIADSGAAALLLGMNVGLQLDGVRSLAITDIDKHGEVGGRSAVMPRDCDLAYVLYTSGSTGVPKGVAMEYGPLSRLVDWQAGQDASVAGATLQYAHLGFDVAFQEILSTLCGSGPLVIARDGERRDPVELARFVSRHLIERIFLPTPALHLFAEAAMNDPPPSLRRIYVAGEQLKITSAIRDFMIRAPHCALHNQYGPTETHVVTSHTLSGDPRSWPRLPPIGTALPHVSIYLRDATGHEVAHGEVGEIYVAGQCLARGYLNKEALTAQRFIRDQSSGRRAYRTGDLGCLVDGQLHYRGRIDRQVKIRGYRVEPDEIEARIAEHPNVAEVAVVAETDGAGNQQLVAHIVWYDRSQPGASLEACRASLQSHVPDFMVPTVWVDTPGIPKTASGKIDRRALAENRRRSCASVSEAEKCDAPLLEQLSGIWRRALQIPAVSLDDNFFDVGGNSLLFAHVQNVICTEVGFDVPITVLYENPTIRMLARWFENQQVEMPSGPIESKTNAPAENDRSIAVVGLACRFPGAQNPDQFWKNLCEGVDSVLRSPTTNADQSGFVRATSILPNIDEFDAEFFGFSKRDADILDPQHRVFLECAWEALEDASIDPRRLGGRIGVFAGCGPSTYLLNYVLPKLCVGPSNLIGSIAELMLLIANDKDFIASQVCYKLDLKGPGVNVNAACATSLAAVHYACRSLRERDCDAALAGAASIPVPQLEGYVYEPEMVYSPDGYCRAFDHRAAGTVFGSGVGVVALRRLEDAVRDGDDIYAVIRGSAFSNDGGVKAGFTAPSEDGQVRAIREALTVADVDPGRVGFIEAHGTATAVGDAIEVAALRKVFPRDAARRRALGSVKTNCGHLGWAAGMAGLIKAVLAIHHRRIPPTLHFSKPNPTLNLEASGFFINTELCDWPAEELPFAGVSAFGLGGANSHVVLEGPPRRQRRRSSSNHVVVVPLSARNSGALIELAERYATRLAAEPEVCIEDVAATASMGRKHQPVRRAVVGRTREELVARLSELTSQHMDAPPGRANGPSSRRVVGLFTGQGAERINMGRQLYESEPVFQKTMARADDLLQTEYGIDLLAWLFQEAAHGLSARIDLVQPAVFSLEMALVELWRSWGIHFDATMGHSLGEFAAACTAKVFSFDDGLRLVAERGRLLRSLPDDAAMAAVFLDEKRVRSIIGSRGMPVAIAAVNSSSNTIVSGTKADVSGACAVFTGLGHEVRPLTVSRAGHSPLMDPILDAFEGAAARVPMTAPEIELVSNVTGEVADASVATPRYWRSHLRETVRFGAGLNTIHKNGVGAFIELGAAPHLIGIAQLELPDTNAVWLPSMRPGEDEQEVLARGVVALFESGFDLDWASFQGQKGRFVHLPTYPFQRKRFWIDAPARSPAAAESVPAEFADEQEQNLTYQIEWRPMAAPVLRSDTGRTSESDVQNWVLFADRSGLADRLAEAAAGRGINVIVVKSGHRYNQVDKRHFFIRAQSTDDLERLFEQLAGMSIAATISLWSLDTPSISERDVDADVLTSARPALQLALQLAQRFSARSGAPPLIFVTRGAQRVRNDESDVNPLQSMVWGFARSAALENSGGKIVRIDLPIDVDVDPTILFDAIYLGRQEPELAMRGGRLFSSRLVPKVIPPTSVCLDQQGAYLVTGGLAGLGLWSAQQLVRHGARRLVLAGRTEPQPAAEAAIEAMRALGAHVDIAQLDVAVRAEVVRLLARTEASGTRIRGIIHCAGVIDDDVLGNQTWDRFEAVLHPKVRGAWILHSLARERLTGLDFLLLQSSATAVLGNFGQASHGAACAFLDALAHYRQLKGEPAVAVNWGAFSDVGFLRDRPEILEQLKSRGMGVISASTRAKLLPIVLSTKESQFAVLPNDWSVYSDYQDSANDPFLATIRTESRRKDRTHQPSLANLLATAEDRKAELLSNVYREVRRLLGAGNPGSILETKIDLPLRDMGLDSLGFVQLRNILQKRLNVSLPPRLVYEHSTVRRLVDYLLTEVITEEWCARVRARMVDANKVELQSEQNGSASEAALASTPLSIQQQRWLRLIRKVDYGQRVVPILFHAALDRRALLIALKCVIGRHEVLRHRFPDDRPAALSFDEIILPASQFFVDLRGLGKQERLTEIRRQITLTREGLGDPTTCASWTLRCLESSSSEFILLLGLQHLAFDGTSLSVFVDELREAYLGSVNGETVALRPATQYSEYAVQQYNYMAKDGLADRPFFEGLYSSIGKTTALPKHPGFVRTLAMPSLRYTADTPLADWADLAEVSRQLDIAPFALLMSTYAALVGELTSCNQVIIGVIASGRGDPRFNRTIGPFTCPIPVPIHIDDRDPIAFARRVNRLVGSITARSMYPSPDLTNYIDAFAGFPIDTYFTDTCINFLNYRREGPSEALQVEVLEILGPVRHPEFADCGFDQLRRIPGLHLIADVSEGKLRANYWYHTERFQETRVRKWASRHREILRKAIRTSLGQVGR